MGRPNPHEREDVQVGARLIIADPASPVGGTGRGSSTLARPRQQDSWIWGIGHRTLDWFGSVVHRGEQFLHDSEDALARAHDVADALLLADTVYGPRALARLAVEDIRKFAQAFLRGLLMALGIVAATTLLGATIAGIVGLVIAGPAGGGFGAVAGGEIGFDVGMAILDYLGIAILLKHIVDQIPGVVSMAKAGLEIAWNAGHDPKHPREADIDLAARTLGEAQAHFTEILIDAALMWMLSMSAVARTGRIFGNVRGAIQNPATLVTRGEELSLRAGHAVQALRQSPKTVETSLKEAAAELAALLRRGSKNAAAFVEWIERNIVELLEKLKKTEPPKELEEGEGAKDVTKGLSAPPESAKPLEKTGGTRTSAEEASRTGPGSATHKAQRWNEYRARGGSWDYERWSKTYENNMERARRAHVVVDSYRDQLGWGEREVTVEIEGEPRRLDIADVATQRGVEVKSGYQTLNQENQWELLRDRVLVEQGWDIEWHFSEPPSAPLLDALEDAGIRATGPGTR